ncbi:IS66 family transposase ISRel15 [Asticcacaulis sp. MM231]|uniref:IS66 family transposase n=1 Tax=Asticcacaulis sp. MM231 TaxID=3157666 RepID=UPI0032D57167
MSDPTIILPKDPAALMAFALEMAQKAARVEALEAEVSVLKGREDALNQRLDRLNDILKIFNRGRFSRKSESLQTPPAKDDEQLVLLFEEVSTGVGALEAEIRKGRAKSSASPSRPRKSLPAHLERVEVVIEPEEPAEHAGKMKVRIGEDRSERLDVLPVTYRVIVTVRPRYAYKDKTIDGVLQARAPNHIVEAGLPTEGLLAHIAVAKYADGLPLYRQEAIFARQDIEVSRQVMASWMGVVGFELTTLHAYMMKQLLKAERLFADETVLPTLSPGNGKVLHNYLWAYVKDDRPFGRGDPPIVVYQFEDGRSGDRPKRHLASFNGVLQVDGYTAYKQLEKAPDVNAGIRLAGCWAHVRRKFYDLHANKSSAVATQTVEIMAALWRHEDEVRGQSPEVRAAYRLAHSEAVVDDLFKLWEKTLPQLSQKSSMAVAIKYALRRREVLERFLYDGRIELDSNIVERAIRPQTMRDSLCILSSSVCKHWKRVRVRGATRGGLPGQRRFNRVRGQVRAADLMWRSGNNLLRRQDPVLDETPDHVAGYA